MRVELTDLRCEPEQGDPRNLEVALELLAQAQVHCRRPVTLLQDVYSTSCQMEVGSKAQTLCQFGEQSIRTQTVRELLETGEMVRGIAASRLSLGQVTQSREGAQLLLTVESWLTILYLDEGEQVQCLRKMMPVTCRLDCPEGYRCTCTCTCPGEVFAAPAAGGIEVRFSLDFHCLTVSTFQVAAVEQAKLGEPRTAGEGTRPSVVLRLPVQGEGIWEIAKSYGTTMEEIIQANELEGEELPLGKMLLIPGVRG